MLWIILAIILIGLVLVFLEIFLIPGTTLFGIAGGVALVIGVLLVYNAYGNKWGNVALGFTSVAVLVSIVAGFRVIQSNKLAMRAEITGRVNELQKNTYNVGDRGVAVSELRPNGKGMFNENKVDIYSNGDYVERGTQVEIVRISNDKIFVKTI